MRHFDFPLFYKNTTPSFLPLEEAKSFVRSFVRFFMRADDDDDEPQKSVVGSRLLARAV